VLEGLGAAALFGALGGCTSGPRGDARPGIRLPALRASPDRITQITVCTRPFRARGPRLEVEHVGAKTVVHNYGHGGSGWSLSWGSSAIAVEYALATGERNLGVIGCGALGLTSSILLQRAGARVTIYAKELPPNVRSSLASGIWSPDSRICLAEHATPAFKTVWERMARESFRTYQNLLGLSGEPIEFIDSYFVTDSADGNARRRTADARPEFAHLQRELIDDLIPRPAMFAPGTHPFGRRYVRRNTLMMFNITAYARMLIADFLALGGKIEIVEFRSPGELAALPQNTLINATGYGARALFDDSSVVPVRGQLARMIPQDDVHYGLFYDDVSFVPRRDGLVFQVVGADDYYGYGDDSTTPDRAEAERAVTTIASLYPRA
jgi:glycine/D-amino acid oxidase-like deaminating enzyme